MNVYVVSLKSILNTLYKKRTLCSATRKYVVYGFIKKRRKDKNPRNYCF